MTPFLNGNLFLSKTPFYPDVCKKRLMAGGLSEFETAARAQGERIARNDQIPVYHADLIERPEISFSISFRFAVEFRRAERPVRSISGL